MEIDLTATLFKSCLVIGILLVPYSHMQAFFRARGPWAPPADLMIWGYMTLGNVCSAAFQVIWPVFCLLFFHIFQGLANNLSLIAIFFALWALGGILIGMAVDWSHHSRNNVLKARWHILFYLVWPFLYLLRWRLFPDQPIDVTVSAFFLAVWFMGMPLIEWIVQRLRQ